MYGVFFYIYPCFILEISEQDRQVTKMSKAVSKYFTTNDNVKLHYLEAGVGKTIIMLPGAGFSADLFKNQIAEFKKKI
jgi:hypothetical protein